MKSITSLIIVLICAAGFQKGFVSDALAQSKSENENACLLITKPVGTLALHEKDNDLSLRGYTFRLRPGPGEAPELSPEQNLQSIKHPEANHSHELQSKRPYWSLSQSSLPTLRRWNKIEGRIDSWLKFVVVPGTPPQLIAIPGNPYTHAD